jgi:hypothetical protein
VLHHRGQQPGAALGDVDVQPLVAHRHAEPDHGGHLARPRTGAVDDAVGPQVALVGAHGEAAPGVEPGVVVDRLHGDVGAQLRTVLGRADGVQRGDRERVGVPLARAVRRGEDPRRQERRALAQRVALDDLGLDARELLELVLVVQQLHLLGGLGDHPAAGLVQVDVAVELVVELLPQLVGLQAEPGVGEQPVAVGAGTGAAQLVDGELQVEAAGVGAGRLAVELAAVEQDHLDTGAGEVEGERGTGDAAADDGDVGLGGQRGAQRVQRRDRTQGAGGRCAHRGPSSRATATSAPSAPSTAWSATKSPGSATSPSAIAEIGTGRTGIRAVAKSTVPTGRSCALAIVAAT